MDTKIVVALITAGGVIVAALIAHWDKLPWARKRPEPERWKRTPMEWAQLRLGSAGYPVKIDGLLGPETTKALMAFQRHSGLPDSGTIDEATDKALKAAQEAFRPVQTMLRSLGYAVQVDGLCGRASIAALRRFQADEGLEVTGSADAATRDRLRVRSQAALR